MTVRTAISAIAFLLWAGLNRSGLCSSALRWAVSLALSSAPAAALLGGGGLW